ncbi:MAG: binding-protein-dependent transport system inner rane component [Acidimicrobiaceae bacterium]|nr:binding-protein-dependent transport system inner rane component [Acidimicrobiaceae bacterium]
MSVRIARAGDTTLEQRSGRLAARRRRRLERRRARREADLAAVVPMRLYGLRRGTVTLLTGCAVLFALFILAPLVWIVVNATKTQANVYGTFGFWFARPFVLFHNLGLLMKSLSGSGVYLQWMGNTVLYAVLGGAGATVLCSLAGYGFARFRFRGSKAMFYLILSALLVPITAVALPLYLVYAKVGLINSIWGMVLPSMVSPVGVYLMRTFTEVSVPRELIDAARMDGASELGAFLRIAVPLMVPGVVTVLLLSIVAVWNNYFLPLIIFTHNSSYPLTVGLALLAQGASSGTKGGLVPVLIAGGLVTIIPVIVLFVFLQRYFRGDLLRGSTTG